MHRPSERHRGPIRMFPPLFSRPAFAGVSLLCALAMIQTACPSPPSGGDDAGTGGADAGNTADAGTQVDAGVDSGMATDSGTPGTDMDAGSDAGIEPPSCGPTMDWKPRGWPGPVFHVAATGTGTGTGTATDPWTNLQYAI